MFPHVARASRGSKIALGRDVGSHRARAFGSFPAAFGVQVALRVNESKAVLVPVDCNFFLVYELMVVPAEHDEVIDIGVAATLPWNRMVDFCGHVGVVAARKLACAISCNHCSALSFRA